MEDFSHSHGVECECNQCQSRYGGLGLIVRGMESLTSAQQMHQSTYQQQPEGSLLFDNAGQMENITFQDSADFQETGFASGQFSENLQFASTYQYYQQQQQQHNLETIPSATVSSGSTSTSYQANSQSSSFVNYPFQSAAMDSYPVMLQDFKAATTTTTTSQLDQPSTSRGFPKDEPQSSTQNVARRTKKTCFHCQKEFNHTGDFRKHLRKHTKEKPFSCGQCGKRFSHTSNLHRHERSHTGDRPFNCERCSKKFNRKDKLDSHKKSKSCRNRRHDERK